MVGFSPSHPVQYRTIHAGTEYDFPRHVALQAFHVQVSTPSLAASRSILPFHLHRRDPRDPMPPACTTEARHCSPAMPGGWGCRCPQAPSPAQPSPACPPLAKAVQTLLNYRGYHCFRWRPHSPRKELPLCQQAGPWDGLRPRAQGVRSHRPSVEPLSLGCSQLAFLHMKYLLPPSTAADLAALLLKPSILTRNPSISASAIETTNQRIRFQLEQLDQNPRSTLCPAYGPTFFSSLSPLKSVLHHHVRLYAGGISVRPRSLYCTSLVHQL